MHRRCGRDVTVAGTSHAQEDPTISASSGVPPNLRQRILADLVREEVTGGARVDHRDTVTAVLAKGRDRLLVVVDEAGSVHVDRLERPARRRSRLVAVAAAVLAITLVLVLITQLDIQP